MYDAKIKEAIAILESVWVDSLQGKHGQVKESVNRVIAILEGK